MVPVNRFARLGRPGRFGFAFLCAALVATFAGCTAPSTGPAPKSGTVDVEMKNVKFVPEEITVKTGATVRWTNEDSLAHDVTAGDGSWNSTGGPGGMEAGAVYSRTFTSPGTFDYYCTLHSSGPGNGMWGRLKVVA